MAPRDFPAYVAPMPGLAIVTEHAESAAEALAGHAAISDPPVISRHLAAGSPLGAALTMLEHRLAAVDRTLGAHLTAAAIELRSAAGESRRADR